jgi:hypothetical protein
VHAKDGNFAGFRLDEWARDAEAAADYPNADYPNAPEMLETLLSVVYNR